MLVFVVRAKDKAEPPVFADLNDVPEDFTGEFIVNGERYRRISREEAGRRIKEQEEEAKAQAENDSLTMCEACIAHYFSKCNFCVYSLIAGSEPQACERCKEAMGLKCGACPINPENDEDEDAITMEPIHELFKDELEAYSRERFIDIFATDLAEATKPRALKENIMKFLDKGDLTGAGVLLSVASYLNMNDPEAQGSKEDE